MGRAFVAQEPTEAARAAFLRVARELSQEHANWLESERNRSLDRAAQPGILWDELVTGIVAIQSGTSWDRLSDHGKVPETLCYETLHGMDLEQRQAHIEAALASAGVYRKADKAAWLAKNVAKMERRNGPENALKLFEEAPGRDGKTAFLRRFAGVGNKLSRHIPMRLYHAEFRDSIAIDARISNISELLGLRLRSFNDEERWYVTAAHDIGLDGWTLDRAMYHTYEDFKTRLAEELVAKASV